MAKKKKKKTIAKCKAKADQRKARKKKLRLVKMKQQKQRPRSGNDHFPQGFDLPPLVPDEVPPGFRSVGMSEALSEFVKAIIKHPELQGVESMEQAFKLAMPLWNHAIATERGQVNAALKSECCKAVMQAFKVNFQEAELLLEKIVTLKQEMFPPDVQPQGGPVMFMRKGTRHVIEPFDYSRLVLDEKKLPLTEEDERFVALLTELDESKLADSEDYDKWARLYDPMEEQCAKSFRDWMERKGVDQGLAADFAFMATFFTNFVYQYDHDDPGVLSNTDEFFFEDFFYDFVLRKIMMEPEEHVDWAPALRIFFLYLEEVGYFPDAGTYVDTLNTFEEPFLQLLRREFG